MEYLFVGEADLRRNICLFGEQTKDGIFACWRRTNICLLD